MRWKELLQAKLAVKTVVSQTYGTEWTREARSKREKGKEEKQKEKKKKGLSATFVGKALDF